MAAAFRDSALVLLIQGNLTLILVTLVNPTLLLCWSSTKARRLEGGLTTYSKPPSLVTYIYRQISTRAAPKDEGVKCWCPHSAMLHHSHSPSLPALTPP